MSSPTTDRGGLRVLTLDECLDLLRTTPVGRVGFVAAGEVEMLPVNYALDGSSVVFRTGIGSKMDAAVEHHTVSFEADGYDAATRDGWSVLMKGTCEIVTDADALARYDSIGPRPWAGAADRPHWVRIRADEVTGRQLTGGYDHR